MKFGHNARVKVQERISMAFVATNPGKRDNKIALQSR